MRAPVSYNSQRDASVGAVTQREIVDIRTKNHALVSGVARATRTTSITPMM